MPWAPTLVKALGLLLHGEEPEPAKGVKLSGNFLIASVIEALGEAIALVGKAGIDRGESIDFLTSTLFSAPV
jgi:3-hydroxyisobutyrate dehydrogenase-like beta-hydroxyacid dehydrogenase